MIGEGKGQGSFETAYDCLSLSEASFETEIIMEYVEMRLTTLNPSWTGRNGIKVFNSVSFS